MRTCFKSLIAASLVLSLAACGNVSRDIAKDGHDASELEWPAPDSVTPMHKGGTFPNLASLRQMRAGLNKQQVSDLIGYPHFSEGVWGVREWNYVFNFRKPDSDEVTVCQYKVLFDDDKVARSFYWKPEECARFVAAPEPPIVEAKPIKREMTLSADALFAFDRSSISDVTDGGRAELDHLAGELSAEQSHISRIQILGYTDRLGSNAYNQQLSERRAQTVAAYLSTHGVPSNLVEAEGRGKSDAIAKCPNGARQAVIACLAPNRRVVVRVDTRDD